MEIRLTHYRLLQSPRSIRYKSNASFTVDVPKARAARHRLGTMVGDRILLFPYVESKIESGCRLVTCAAMGTSAYISLLACLVFEKNAVSEHDLVLILEAQQPVNPFSICNFLLQSEDKFSFDQAFRTIVLEEVDWAAVQGAVRDYLEKVKDNFKRTKCAEKETKDLPIIFGSVDLRKLISLLKH